jgi:hypothetical protein
VKGEFMQQERKSERVEFIAVDQARTNQIYDLSRTGVSCFHTEAKEKNSFVVVKINNLLLRAKVIYCQKRESDYRLGLQFWNILPERQAALNEMVDGYSRGVPIACSLVDEKKSENGDTQGQETKKIETAQPKKKN